MNNRYWVVAPGENAILWPDFYRDGIIAIDWHYLELGDLHRFKSKEELRDSIEKRGFNTKGSKYPGMIWDFYHEMKAGDYIFAKDGTKCIMGVGVIESDYYYDKSHEYMGLKKDDRYEHRRKVRWLMTKTIEYKKKIFQPRTVSAIKDIYAEKVITKYLEDALQYYEKITSVKRRYFWINTNENEWMFHQNPVGQEETFLFGGVKKQCYYDARIGDIFIGFQSTPTKKIVAIGKISMEMVDLYGEGEIGVEKYIDLKNPVSISELKEAGLGDIPVVKKHQGTIFDMNQDDFCKVLNVIEKMNQEVFSDINSLKGDSVLEKIDGLSKEQAIRIAKRNGSYLLGWYIPIGAVFSTEQVIDQLKIHAIGGIRKSDKDKSVIIFDDSRTGLSWSGTKAFTFSRRVKDYLIDWLDELPDYGSQRDIFLESGLEERVHVIKPISSTTYRYLGVASLRISGFNAEEDPTIIVRGELNGILGEEPDESHRSESDYTSEIEGGFEYLQDGSEREVLAKARVNQSAYRKELINRYHTCCLCHVKNENLLIASHIKPWTKCESGKEKTDINNGLLLCANHDRLFDRGLISFSTDGKIIISAELKENDRLLLNVNDNMKLDISSDVDRYMAYHRMNIYEHWKK